MVATGLWEAKVAYSTERSCQTYGLMISLLMGVIRKLVSDKEERQKILNEAFYREVLALYQNPAIPEANYKEYHIPEDCHDARASAQIAHFQDQISQMPGRVVEIGPDRAEKEIWSCPMEVCGEEICWASRCILQAIIDVVSPGYEALMPEARGAGDKYCRVIIQKKGATPAKHRD